MYDSNQNAASGEGLERRGDDSGATFSFFAGFAGSGAMWEKVVMRNGYGC